MVYRSVINISDHANDQELIFMKNVMRLYHIVLPCFELLEGIPEKSSLWRMRAPASTQSLMLALSAFALRRIGSG